MTSSEVAEQPVVIWPDQAGVWRRFAAFSIDVVLVTIAVSLLVAALHWMTKGEVEAKNLSIRWSICRDATVNEGSSPELADYEWKMCSTSFFGLPLARWIEGTQGAEGADQKSVDLSVDHQGSIRPTPLDVSFIQWAVLFMYLFLMEWGSGAPIGKRVMALMVHDDDDFQRVGLPTKKSFVRQVVKLFGMILTIPLEAWSAFANWGHQEELALLETTTADTLLTYVAIVAIAIMFIWSLWVVISMAISDAIQDRFAGTSVRYEPN